MADGITHSEVHPDENLARVLLIRARGIAPQLRTVVDNSEQKKDALAVLKRVAQRAVEAGTGAIAAQGRNGTSLTLRAIDSAWRDEDIEDLRAVFTDGVPTGRGGLPLGSFPTERPISRLFPEGPYA